MENNRYSDLSRCLANLTMAHATDIARLPEPPAEFRWRDVPVPDKILYRLAHRGALEQTACNRDDDAEHSLYRAKPRVHALASSHAAHTNTLPCCGATGIVNDGGTIRCNRCGEPVDRDDAREVLV